MINKEEVISFFDAYAEKWDDEMIKDDEIISIILDNAGVKKNISVLDVACGTGVLIPYYYEREVSSITGIDISEKMIEIAKSKYDYATFICADAEEYIFDKKFDSIVIYNAFPHFEHPENIIKVLSEYLKDGGCFSIAHGMSREKINMHHSGSARHISNSLMDINDLANIFKKYLKVKDKISNDKMYQVTGIK